MKRFGLALFLLLLVGSTSLAQDEQPNTGPDPDVKLLNLYALKGRSWTIKATDWSRGSTPSVTRSTWKVDDVKDGKARINSTWRSSDGGTSGRNEYTVSLSEPSENDKLQAGKHLPEVELDMGFRKFRCKKLVTKTDEREETTWISVEFHPLAVKQVVLEKQRVAIRKLTALTDGASEPWCLYRKQGRRWKHRTSYGAGGIDASNTMDYTVKQVRDDGATYTLSISDDKGKVLFSQDQEMEFPQAANVEADLFDFPDMALKSCAAGEFLCYHFKLGGVESWTSVQWPGLLIASKAEAYEMELVEFDLGHDEHALYRTSGNYYVTRGANGETTRVEVKEVSETEASFSVTVTDAAGKVVSTKEDRHLLPTEPVSQAYTGQQEQTVHTAAGTFPAIRTVGEDGTVRWSWNGIVILAESQGTVAADAETRTIELTELKME